VSELVADDLSCFVIPGRVKSHLPEAPVFETSVRTPAQAIEDGVEAERLGFRRVWIADRPDLKEPATLLGGIAARTKRIGVATGMISAGSRHPMLYASIGATMHAAYGPRFTLGLGRGAPSYSYAGHLTRKAYADYCTIIKKIWAGEKFRYDGPAGALGELGLGDRYEGPSPEIVYGAYGLPKATQLVAETPAIDGLMMPAMVTPRAVAKVRRNIEQACERTGRDPGSVRLIVEVVTAPDLAEEETRQIAHARAVTYLQPPAWSRSYCILNDWDPAVVRDMQSHSQFEHTPGPLADLRFHRTALTDPARLIPDEWMHDACAIGTVQDCVTKLEAFKQAGADEIAVYGSTPTQNAGLIKAWCNRPPRGSISSPAPGHCCHQTIDKRS
jgi:5,10-methylenetetrahydromethanopterin reductase